MSVKTWGDFEIDLDRVLGRGGMGAVYMGRQVSLDRPAAIKVLKKELTQNAEFVKRFQREAALLARLVDSNVVQVFGAGQGDGEYFYAMEFVEGQDFSSRLRSGGKFTADEVLQVALQVGRALQAAWKHRIVHRDIKPSNIILTKDGPIKVMDFGLAKNTDSDLTQSEVIMGTAKYMSPEQATGGDVDVRSDLYSLGAVLYELATGKPPFIGESPTAVIYQHVHHQPRAPREINPAVPEDLQAMVLRLLAKDPKDRFASPEALVSAVQCILEGVTPDEKSTLYNETLLVDAEADPSSGFPGGPPPPPPPARSGPWPLVLSLGAAALVLGVGGYFLIDAVNTTEIPPDPLPRPPVATANGEKPLPPPPPARAWEDPLKRGTEAFGERKWELAYTLLEEALAKSAPKEDVEEKINRARAYERVAKGDEAREDDEKALESYEAALQYLPKDEEIQRKAERARHGKWRASAARNELGGDWPKAAADWARAAESGQDEARREEARANREFCRSYADGLQARTKGQWRETLKIFQELLRQPRTYLGAIEVEVARAKKEVEALDEAAGREVRDEHEKLLRAGRDAVRRAQWGEAKAAFDKAADPKFQGLAKDEAALREVALGLGAPRGMLYVPGGKFRMGGGREVEGPGDGEAEVPAFYLDEREVRVSEYAAFLEALEGAGGHHSACPKDEPAGKRHRPDLWGSQKPDDPVVYVDWWDAASYAAWAKKRLPREAEWERAAGFDPLAGRRLYPWGGAYQKEEAKSYLGIEGLGGGVIEWTADWFQKYAWGLTSHYEFGERNRVLRGGASVREKAEEEARVTYRHWYLPGKRVPWVGFRCAKDVER